MSSFVRSTAILCPIYRGHVDWCTRTWILFCPRDRIVNSIRVYGPTSPPLCTVSVGMYLIFLNNHQRPMKPFASISGLSQRWWVSRVSRSGSKWCNKQPLGVCEKTSRLSDCAWWRFAIAWESFIVPQRSFDFNRLIAVLCHDARPSQDIRSKACDKCIKANSKSSHQQLGPV